MVNIDGGKVVTTATAGLLAFVAYQLVMNTQNILVNTKTLEFHKERIVKLEQKEK